MDYKISIQYHTYELKDICIKAGESSNELVMPTWYLDSHFQFQSNDDSEHSFQNHFIHDLDNHELIKKLPQL